MTLMSSLPSGYRAIRGARYIRDGNRHMDWDGGYEIEIFLSQETAGLYLCAMYAILFCMISKFHK